MRPRSLLLSVALAALVACGDDDPNGPAAPATGQYTAVQFTTTLGALTTDHLAEGATVTLNLLEGGTTTGHAFVPATGGVPETDLDLAGTWDQDGNRVELDLDADIFLEDVVFIHDDGILSADETFSGVRIRITLAREELL